MFRCSFSALPGRKIACQLHKTCFYIISRLPHGTLHRPLQCSAAASARCQVPKLIASSPKHCFYSISKLPRGFHRLRNIEVCHKLPGSSRNSSHQLSQGSKITKSLPLKQGVGGTRALALLYIYIYICIYIYVWLCMYINRYQPTQMSSPVCRRTSLWPS